MILFIGADSRNIKRKDEAGIKVISNVSAQLIIKIDMKRVIPLINKIGKDYQMRSIQSVLN